MSDYKNRFKFDDEQCRFCIFNLGFCGAPGNSTQPLICDPVDRLYESFKPKRSYKSKYKKEIYMKNVKKRDKLNKYQIEVQTEDLKIPKGFVKFDSTSQNWYYKDFVGTLDNDRDLDFIKSNILSKFQNIINYKIEMI